MVPFSNNHADYLKETCTRSPCKYWHPSECQFFPKPKRVAKAGDKCLFTHHKVDEQPNKKPKKDHCSHKRREKRRQECCGYCENCTAIGLRLAGLGCTGFSKTKTASEKPNQKVLGSIRKVRFTKSTLRQASMREKKGPSIGKINVEVPHQRSPYVMKCEDWSHEETERQQRCARSKAWNLAKNIYKLKEKDKADFFFTAEEWVLRLRQQKSRRKESLW